MEVMNIENLSDLNFESFYFLKEYMKNPIDNKKYENWIGYRLIDGPDVYVPELEKQLKMNLLKIQLDGNIYKLTYYLSNNNDYFKDKKITHIRYVDVKKIYRNQYIIELYFICFFMVSYIYLLFKAFFV